MRSLLMEEIFPACKINLHERAIDMDELAECQQLLLCNSVRGLMRVNEIYNVQNELLRTLSADRQTLILSDKLTEMYPCF
jgi:branched-subunit amino acid aminotransferase/4-amino-4-deoxychorismate lyase